MSKVTNGKSLYPFGQSWMPWLVAGVAVLLGLWLVIRLLPEGDASSVKEQSNAQRASVVLVTLDTMRADYVSAYGSKKVSTPHLDALAAEGVLFETTISEVPLTLPAHSIMMTGSYPMATGVRDNIGYRLEDKHLTLAEILQADGYRTAAFPAAYVLHSKWGIGQGFEVYDDQFRSGRGDVESTPVERPGEEVADISLEWLGTVGESRFFCWIHLFDPHDPYEPPEPYASQYSEDPYAGEVAYTDQIVGRILSFLRQHELYENTLIVVVGDHGEALGAHGEPTHGFFVYDEALRVPLIIKPPSGWLPESRRGEVIGGLAQLVHLAPTVLEMLDLERGESFQGQSLCQSMLGEADPAMDWGYSETYYPRQFGWSELRAIRTPRAKFIAAPEPEFYDLREDPTESENLFETRTEEALTYLSRLEEFDVRYGRKTADELPPVEISPDELERLRALGYVGSTLSSVPEGKTVLPDPKEKLKSYRRYLLGVGMIAEHRYREALPVLTALRREEPESETVETLLGQCYLGLGQAPEAERALNRALDLNPDSFTAKFNLAKLRFGKGEVASAEALFRELAEGDPRFFPAQHYLGLLYSDQGRTVEAIEAFSNAVLLRDDAGAYQMLGYVYTRDQRPEDAARALEEAIRIEPDNALSHLYLANAYLEMGQEAAGREELMRAFELDPSLRERIPGALGESQR